MKKREIENELKAEIEEKTPDVLDDILAECREQNLKTAKIDEPTALSVYRRRRGFAALIAAVLAVAVIVPMIVVFASRALQTENEIATTETNKEETSAGQTPTESPTEEPTPTKTAPAPTESLTPAEPTVEAKVYIDVNPSVKIELDEEKTVLSVTGINDDGKALLLDTDFVGKNAETAVKGVVALTVRDGYLNETNSDVLLSVSADDAALEKELCLSLAASVNDLIEETMRAENVRVTALDSIDDIDDFCETYGVSPGKATLIKRILEAKRDYTLDQLLASTVNEILSICRHYGLPTGKAVLKEDKIIKMVIADAGINASVDEIYSRTTSFPESIASVVLMFEHYDYKFCYTVDRYSGKILSKEVLPKGIDKAAAYEIALKELGLIGADVDFRVVEYNEFVKENGTFRSSFFDVHIQKDGVEYIIYVSSEAGEILYKTEKEALLYPKQYCLIVLNDLGISYKEEDPWETECGYDYIAGYGNSEVYRTLAVVRVEYSKQRAIYIVDRKTGEILYKEIGSYSQTDLQGYSLDEAVAMAKIAAKIEGAKETELVNISGDKSFLVKLLEDGKEMTYKISYGTISKRTASEAGV